MQENYKRIFKFSLILISGFYSLSLLGAEKRVEGELDQVKKIEHLLLSEKEVIDLIRSEKLQEKLKPDTPSDDLYFMIDHDTIGRLDKKTGVTYLYPKDENLMGF